MDCDTLFHGDKAAGPSGGGAFKQELFDALAWSKAHDTRTHQDVLARLQSFVDLPDSLADSEIRALAQGTSRATPPWGTCPATGKPIYRMVQPWLVYTVWLDTTIAPHRAIFMALALALPGTPEADVWRTACQRSAAW